MDSELREIVEDIVNLATIQMVRPIEKRLVVIETKLSEKRKRKEKHENLVWKVIGVGFAIPSFLIALLALLKN